MTEVESEQLDLDINNYSLNDLEKFFRFSKHTEYTPQLIELREAKIRKQLLDSGHIDKRFKTELIGFLTKAKQMLMEKKCPPPKPASVLPKNYRLDTLDYPRSATPPLTREVDLIQRKEVPFIHTLPGDYFPGTMNPLNTRVISKCLTIDTRFRDNYMTTSSTDFTFQLPMKLSKVVSMQMSSFEIPVAFYGISASYGNNFLYVKVVYGSNAYDDEDIVEEKIFVVPDGNYNAQDLIDKINEMMCPKTFDGKPANPNDIFSNLYFSLDITESGSGTGKVKLQTTGIACHRIKEVILDFTKDKNGNPDLLDISSKIGWNLGFTKKIYSGKTEYVSETLIEPASIRYIYLAIDDFNNSVNNHFVTAFNQSILSPNILARISIKGTYFSLLMENDLNIVTEPRQYFGPVDIQRLRVRLFDDHGRILEMNGANYSFCLILKILYDA
jgi:hypothetical protein